VFLAARPVLAIAWLALVLAVSRLGWLTALALRLLSNILSRRWEDTARRLQEDDPSLNLGASAAFAGGYLLNNLIGAVAFVFVVLSLGDLDWSDLPLVMGGYSLAAVIGIVAIFAPAGLGVREAVLAGFLTPVVASPVAVSIAFLIRALTVLADVLFLGSVEMGMRAGAAGLIAGRNMWQRPRADALGVIDQVHAILARFASDEA